LTPMSDSDRLIALSLIDAIDPNGQLTSSIETIHASLVQEIDIDPDEGVAVLARIQQLDPVGVGYRDLRECLAAQARQLDPELPGVAVARQVIAEFLPQLASHDYNLILRKLRIKEEELKEAVAVIRSLNPRPGSEITPSETSYVIPDVFVGKHNGRWKVEL